MHGCCLHLNQSRPSLPACRGPTCSPGLLPQFSLGASQFPGSSGAFAKESCQISITSHPSSLPPLPSISSTGHFICSKITVLFLQMGAIHWICFSKSSFPGSSLHHHSQPRGQITSQIVCLSLNWILRRNRHSSSPSVVGFYGFYSVPPHSRNTSVQE